MPLSRRTPLRAGGGAPALPASARAATRTTLRFIPVIDLAFTDPIYAGAQVSRDHGLMVYDTLYGMNPALDVSPQVGALLAPWAGTSNQPPTAPPSPACWTGRRFSGTCGPHDHDRDLR